MAQAKRASGAGGRWRASTRQLLAFPPAVLIPSTRRPREPTFALGSASERIVSHAGSSTSPGMASIVWDAVRLSRSSFACTWVPGFVLALALAMQETLLILHLPDLRWLAWPSAPGPFAGPLEALLTPRFIGAELALTLLALTSFGALLACQLAIARGRQPLSAGAAFARGLRRLPEMALASMLYLIVVIAGAIALLVPALYFGARLQLWPVRMFAEETGPFGSLGASWRLMKGRLWRGTTVLSIALLAVVIASAAVGMLVGSVIAFLQPGASGERIIEELFAVPVNAIIYPFVSAAWIVTYHDLKLRQASCEVSAAPRQLPRREARPFGD